MLDPRPPDGPRVPHHRRLLGLAAVAAVALYAWPLSRPALHMDDFQILVRSWTWERAWAELWVPANEHAMPLGRLTTWALAQAAGRPAALPWVCAWQGPLAVVIGMGLLYLFVRRELEAPLYGLAAAALFGVTSVYQQAVVWFAASFSVLTLDTFLLALLAAQAWRHTGRGLYLALGVAACAAAPAWFASGVLAGPLCGLYLLGPDRPTPRLRDLLRRLGPAVLPSLGTALFLAVSLPRTAQAILHLEHYQGKDAVSAFRPWTGLLYTLRSVVENLLLGAVGVGSVSVPAVGVAVGWAALLAGGLRLWRSAPAGRRLMALGAGTALAGYLLVYSARADWRYDAVGMNGPAWSRYHLLPQLGLALCAAGGLTARRERPGPELSPRQARAFLGLIVCLFVCQAPRVLLTTWGVHHAAQQAVLREVEAVDALCRRHRIAAATARKALPFLTVPDSAGRENGWEFLRGSPDPDPTVTPDRARRLLTAAGSPARGERQVPGKGQ